MKTRITILTIITTLFISFVFSQQSTTDSLLTLLDKVKDGNKRTDLLNNLCNEYTGNNPDKARFYNKQACDLAKKLGYMKGLADSYKYLGVIYLNEGDKNKALMYSEMALKIYIEIDYKQGIANSYNNIGLIYYLQTRNDKALTSYFNSLKIFKELNDKKAIADSYSNMGLIYKVKGNFNRALIYYRMSLIIYTKEKDILGAADIYNNISTIYRIKNKLDTALHYQLKCINIYKKSGNKQNLSDSYINIATIYSAKKKTDKALYYLFKSLIISKEINYKMNIGYAYHNIGRIYFICDYHDKKAFDYVNKSLKISQEIQDIQTIKDNYLLLSEIYAKLNKYEKAYEYHKLYHALYDNINSEYKEARDLEIETEQKDYEITIEKEKSKRYYDRLSFLSVGVVLLIVIGFLFGYNYRQRQKTKIAIMEQDNLQSQFNTLKSQINPHFLFNTFNTLIGVIDESKESAINFVKQLSNTYRYILESRHKNLHEISEELIFIKSYSALLLKRFEGKLIINTNIPEKYHNYFMPPLCLQLLIENATKHNAMTKNEPLTIDIYTDENEMLVIKNNIHLKIDPVQSTKVGLENIKSRYKYFTDKQVEIISDGKEYIVKLPLLKNQTV